MSGNNEKVVYSNTQRNITNLPEDMMSMIISKLENYRDLLALKSTCKKMKQVSVVDYDLKNYKCLDVNYKDSNHMNKVIKSITENTNTNKYYHINVCVGLGHKFFYDTDYSILSNIHTVNFSHKILTEPYIKYINNVFRIDLETKFTIETLKNINACEIDFSYSQTKMTNDFLKELSKKTNLKKIIIPCSENITDDGLKYLRDCVDLHTLDVSFCDNITDDGLKYLGECPKLHTLDMSFCDITDDGLKYLGECSKLHTLNLSSCPNITDDGIKQLSKNDMLKKLTILSDITDDGIISLSNLEVLEICGCGKISPNGISLMKNLKTLIVNVCDSDMCCDDEFRKLETNGISVITKNISDTESIVSDTESIEEF